MTIFLIFSASGIWVTYGKAVYNITSALARHPESKELTKSIGTSADRHWEDVYSFQKTEKILGSLEKYRIGNVLEESLDLKNHQIPKKDLPTYSAEEVSKHSDL